MSTFGENSQSYHHMIMELKLHYLRFVQTEKSPFETLFK